ncbi:DUF6194 family protein [Chitinophaga sp. OAE865]|uniref:DUF6194 family protein n=1 Tax=Chitinophaga sp. OAE865 TaxID=2817898 RepID=UPI001AE688EE
MSLQHIEQHITELPNITKLESFGYTFFFYGPEQVLPFVTFAASDNEHDNVSNLNRDGVFRVNIGISKDSFHQLFTGNEPQWDYTALNRFMPHPHYAAQHFICILNPEGDRLTETINYINEAHLVAKKRFDKKQAAKADN